MQCVERGAPELPLGPLHPPTPAVDVLFGGDDAAAAIERGRALALGALLARYLVEAPPNVCTPT